MTLDQGLYLFAAIVFLLAGLVAFGGISYFQIVFKEGLSSFIIIMAISGIFQFLGSAVNFLAFFTQKG